MYFGVYNICRRCVTEMVPILWVKWYKSTWRQTDKSKMYIINSKTTQHGVKANEIKGIWSGIIKIIQFLKRQEKFKITKIGEENKK